MEVLYICDRRACARCNPSCKHTSDIRHAVNFEASEGVPGTIVEKEIMFPMECDTESSENGLLALSVILWALAVAVTVVTRLL